MTISMYNLDFNQNEFPIIIKPNLGLPILLNLRDFKNEKGNFIKEIRFESIVLTKSDQTIKDIGEFFHLNIHIQPILKDEGNFLDRRGKKIPLKLYEIKKLDITNVDKFDEIIYIGYRIPRLVYNFTYVNDKTYKQPVNIYDVPERFLFITRPNLEKLERTNRFNSKGKRVYNFLVGCSINIVKYPESPKEEKNASKKQ